MKSGVTYTMSINDFEVSCTNKIHTSYFSRPPASTFYAQVGSGSSDLPTSSTNLESFSALIGDVSYGNLVKKVTTTGGSVKFNYTYTWPTSGAILSGSVGEAGLGYSSSGNDFKMVSRGRFLDSSGNPYQIEVTPDDVLGMKIDIDFFKSISPSNVELIVNDNLAIAGKAYDVNLKKWFEAYISRPTPTNLNMCLFNSDDIHVSDNGFNDLIGSIHPARTVSTSASEVGSLDSRKFKYAGYFSPDNDYSFSYIGLFYGTASLASGYYTIIALDSPASITANDEFTITLNLVISEGDLNGNS